MITLVESAAESATVVSSWEPPPWVTDIDTTGDAAADYCHVIGSIADVDIWVSQHDAITTTRAQITISRGEPTIQVADARLSVAETRELIHLLTTAIGTIEGTQEPGTLDTKLGV